MIEVLHPGLYTSIQDRGRFGYRDQGVPLSGAMDQYAAQLANQILGNSADSPLMEFVLQGPTLYFQKAAKIAISGGLWQVELNQKKIQLNQVVHLPAKSNLKIKRNLRGMYGYLAVSGGFELPKVLGSYSFYPKITQAAQLKKGDQIRLGKINPKKNMPTASAVFRKDIFQTNVLEVESGPEFELLSKAMQKKLFTTDFSPSNNSNRMAYLLEHNADFSAEEIITGPVQPGTVQLTPSGNLIVLMRDAQTTGGYARTLQLTPMAINQLAQIKPGESFQFKLKDR